MGTWGAGTFDNDDAMDWVGDFADSQDDRLIVDSLKAVGRELTADEYLEAPTSTSALAAAEAVAALRGKPVKDLPNELAEALKKSRLRPDANLLRMARDVINIITTDARSELKELWDDVEPADSSEWLAATADLQARLAD